MNKDVGHICCMKFLKNNSLTKILKMKKSKLLLGVSTLVVLIGGSILFAADHIDAPAVTNQSTDITDLYVFRGQDQSNLVFVANSQGLLSPSATSNASFKENTLIEFNIDNNGDYVEDLVIQGIVSNGKMKVYGPYKPNQTGSKSMIENSYFTVETAVTPYGQQAVVGTQNGISVFAGPRDDPFFFDLNQYSKIIGGQATSFNNPGMDAFKGTNVLSLVVEVPKSKLGGTENLNVWVETKKPTGM